MPFDETLPLSTDSVLQNGPVNLGARERMTYEEFWRLDPQLAGLYRFGHELVARVNELGSVYLLAHVGRELGRGVIRALTGTDPQVFETSGDEILEGESNKVTISAVLHLPPSHNLVTAWFNLNRVFSEAAHYRLPGPEKNEVYSAFLQFSDLLFGRIAPYFATHVELDRILAIESPTEADSNLLRSVLLRPQQRRYFFSNLKHPQWLRPLSDAGYFDTHPERIVESDGSWRVNAWPEGEYLARIASKQSDLVTEILLRIPKNLKNPAIWLVVIDAAKVLPATRAVQLTPLIEQALKTAPPILFPHQAIDLVKILAEQSEMAAFRLAEHLLWLSRAPEGNGETPHNATRTRWLRGRHETEWVLERIEVYDLSVFCAKALPALEALDPHCAIKLFAKLLDRSVWLIQQTDGIDVRLEHNHRRWCPYLDRSEQDGDVRVIFAVALVSLAQRVVKLNAASAKAVFDFLRLYPGGLFTRIRYTILQSAGSFIQQELDSVISSGELLDPPFGSREAAALLRTQFGNASPDAKRLFCYAIERGPDAEKVKEMVMMRRSHKNPETEHTNGADAPISEAEIADVVGNWQRRRLGRFHNQIPPELRPLAERLGVKPQVPSPEDQALDEDGFYSGGGWVWAGDSSPKTAEELASMGVEDTLTFLATWQSGNGSFDGPSRRGLENTLAALANEHEGFAIGLLDKGTQASLAPGYLKALLDGFFSAAEAKTVIPWERLLPIVVAVVQISAKSGTGTESQQGAALQDRHNLEDRWREVVRVTANLVREGCAKNLIPNILVDDVWEYAEIAVHSPLMWGGGWASPQKNAIEDALMAALNTVGGDFVRMLVDVALWDYHQGEERMKSNVVQAPVSTKVVERLTTLLSHILLHDEKAALGPHSMLGHLIPQIDFLVPQWISAMEDQLFEVGVEDPRHRPIWGAYVTRAGIYNSTFSKLRKWYVRAAEVAESSVEAENQKTRNSEWSLTKGLAIHIIVGIIRGLCNVGDEDALVEKTFSNVPVKDRSHAYWEVFRGWSDSKEAVPMEYAQRIVRFWEWRLTELESAPDTPERADEADGLTWFLKTPYIAAKDAIRLGLRTLRLNSGKQRNRVTTWERLSELAKVDAAGTFDLVENLIEQELLADYAFLPYEDVAPLLKAAFSCADSRVIARTARLINKLGERGYLEFGKLLSSEEKRLADL
ncbi:MAG: hypothetical protein ACKVZH_21645 [Blastocatellia bacterium]